MPTPSPDPERHDIFGRTFDFSKFPNVQEVSFGFRADWSGGDLPWIPVALSTLRPTTSPRLSTVRLSFYSPMRRSLETMITNMGNDLRRIADEIVRIEREFEGAVKFTVTPDSRFQAVLNTLDVRFGFVGWKRPHGDVDSSSFLADLSELHSLKWDDCHSSTHLSIGHFVRWADADFSISYAP